jgi:hypothetical protein
MPTFASIRDATMALTSLTAEEQRMCIDLLDLLQDRVTKHEPGAWTYRTLAKWLGCNPLNEVFLDCVNLLAVHPDLRVLDLHFLFFDPEDSSSEGVPLDEEETQLALQGRGFVNRRTGEFIEQYKSALLPYFTPSAKLEIGGSK